LVKNFDRSQIVLALDFKIIDDHPFICTHGWQNVSKVNLYDFLSSETYFQNILATDISLDGAMNGPSIHTYKYICDNFKSLNLIASGGIKSISDIKTLKELGINESIVGKAIYEKNILLEELVYVN
jgi:phosphoribosylformimino-5-aminoimidazole carboxamide ribotide isomerase